MDLSLIHTLNYRDKNKEPALTKNFEVTQIKNKNKNMHVIK